MWVVSILISLSLKFISPFWDNEWNWFEQSPFYYTINPILGQIIYNFHAISKFTWYFPNFLSTIGCKFGECPVELSLNRYSNVTL